MPARGWGTGGSVGYRVKEVLGWRGTGKSWGLRQSEETWGCNDDLEV